MACTWTSVAVRSEETPERVYNGGCLGGWRTCLAREQMYEHPGTAAQGTVPDLFDKAELAVIKGIVSVKREASANVAGCSVGLKTGNIEFLCRSDICAKLRMRICC